MTRDEAIQNARAAQVSAWQKMGLKTKWTGSQDTDRSAHEMVAVLEAFGLITFDKTPTEAAERFVRDMAETWTGSAKNGGAWLGRAILEDLDKAGFEIRRKT